MTEKVDEYLKQGIHGPRELRPDERRLYLGTFRERVIITLTKFQVGKNTVYDQVVKYIKENKSATLLLNGHMNYRFLSKYISEAQKCGVSYKVVTDNDYNSKYGLVLASDNAINKAVITVFEDGPRTLQSEKDKQEGSLKAFFKKLFKI